MKKLQAFIIGAIAPLLSPVSCFVPAPAEEEPARIRLSLSSPSTRSTDDPFDTPAYELDIKSTEGGKIYDGLWADSPAEFELKPGKYVIGAKSRDFPKPDFNTPQFGDVKTVSLAEGQVVDVHLSATQLNSGIRMEISEEFIANYRGNCLFLKSREGSLAWGYDENRTAFFAPGKIALVLDFKGKGTTIYSAELGPGEIMTLKLDVSEDMTKVSPMTAVNISMDVDTARLYTAREFLWDGSSAGNSEPSESTPSGALDVATARGEAGSKGVWLVGYIVGGDLSSSSCSFEAPFSARTNIVLSDSPSCRDRSVCMSIQLSVGDIRNAINLVDNPGLLGQRIYLKGDVVEAYYKLPGLQNLSDYRL